MTMFVQPSITKIGKIDDSLSHQFAPTPPAGSAVDQDTTTLQPDVPFVVSGGQDGNPSIKNYLSQSVKNDRTPITGFGAILGYVGGVTEELTVMLCSKQLDPHNSGEDICEVGFSISPSELDEGSYYMITAIFEDTPINIPADTEFYIMMVTTQNYDSVNGVYWAWTGFTTNVYSRGKIMGYFDENVGWVDIQGDYDAMFFTFTEGTTQLCSSYNNQTDCVNAECYWWSNGTCHNTAEGTGDECSGYLTELDCTTNDCYWYAFPPWESESCHSQEMIMAYLPYVLIGAGGAIILAALVMGRDKRPQYVNYGPPPRPTHH